MSKPTNDNPSLKLSEGFLVYSGCLFAFGETFFTSTPSACRYSIRTLLLAVRSFNVIVYVAIIVVIYTFYGGKDTTISPIFQVFGRKKMRLSESSAS